MKRMFIYSLWNCERLEKYLSDMEERGFRLNSVQFYYFFHFKKSQPRKVRYVYSYWFGREIELYDAEVALRRDLRAATIPCNNSAGMHIHRIPDTNADVSLFQTMRTEYFKRGLLKRIVFFASLLACFIFFCMHFHNEGTKLFPNLGVVLLMLATIYNVVGIFKLLYI